MSYNDSDQANLAELFPAANELVTWDNERLHQRLQEGQGIALFRMGQLEAFGQDLSEEPRLRLEYDRFSPGLRHDAK